MNKQIQTKLMTLLYWLPRGLAIFCILFLGLFALDVFTGDAPWYQVVLGFFIHLIPNLVLLIALLIAWRHELAGGIVFLFISIFMWTALSNPFWVNLLLCGPIALVGILFVLNHYLAKTRRL